MDQTCPSPPGLLGRHQRETAETCGGNGMIEDGGLAVGSTVQNKFSFDFADDASVRVVPQTAAQEAAQMAKARRVGKPTETAPAKSDESAKRRPLPARRPMGAPATAKPMDELLAKPQAAAPQRRNGPEHVSDLLLVVLEKYGIDADEFLAGLDQ